MVICFDLETLSEVQEIDKNEHPLSQNTCPELRRRAVRRTAENSSVTFQSSDILLISDVQVYFDRGFCFGPTSRLFALEKVGRVRLVLSGEDNEEQVKAKSQYLVLKKPRLEGNEKQEMNNLAFEAKRP